MADADEVEPTAAVYDSSVGDNGRTIFGRHGDLPKWDSRVAAWQDCEEANATISLSMAVSGFTIDVNSTLASVLNDLYDLGADLSVPFDDPEPAKARIHDEHLVRLERAIEYYRQNASDLSGHVLPSGTVAASSLFHARAVVRRAERMTWIAIQQHRQSVNVLTARYLNRLSTLLFVLARSANVPHGGDEYWQPEASYVAMEQEPEATDADDLPTP
ncbi:cob(I)yrinic acid a,c-diamide adenosyltransferase [Salinibacterium sp. ZJ454]|uniref:cob(I)yrinic acid a,c-diamide adenosyltransferase n=1 Tax=Salinibacterium sp. ZJ454 TaxID=2708339 RepID=UPI00141F9A08|nr:cob(I)yrinic acid a,c-diamide adenosyltransferase [Salinibacterium sp. ZJ454]